MTTLHPAFLGRPIAHRGLHDRAAGRIENSRAAVAAAAQAGYGVEIDVQLSADGEAMVFHDAALDRLTAGNGPVRALSAAELGRIALTDGDEGVPTLAEVLATVAGRVALLVEVKDQGGRMDATGVGPLEARVGALLAGYAGPVAVMSFNPASVAALRDAAPGVARGLTSGGPEAWDAPAPAGLERLIAMADWDAVGASFCSYRWRDLPTAETARRRAGGAPVLSWTLRSAADEAAARRHCDNVTFEGYAA